MDEGIVYLVVIAFVVVAVIAIAVAVLSVLASIGPIILASILGVGFIWGSVVGIKNFFEVVAEAHRQLP